MIIDLDGHCWCRIASVVTSASLGWSVTTCKSYDSRIKRTESVCEIQLIADCVFHVDLHKLKVTKLEANIFRKLSKHCLPGKGSPENRNLTISAK